MMKITWMRSTRWIFALICIMVLTSACGARNNNESVQEHAYPQSKEPIAEAGPDSIPNADAKQDNGSYSAQSESSADAGDGIMIDIDQSDKLTEAKSFRYSVKGVPEGYTLSELRWTSNQITIINSVQEATEHEVGENKADGKKEGFYIKDNGQLNEFKYTDEMKGERGKVTLVYTNEAGQEVLAEQEVKLKK
ncbi:hypothetical protein MH215_14275 [Paenibacillus sp. ACRSA]|uniref:hypothetical protein n=1 Tax=Paenibacillus sp. ACRSA TaxID=2918211 RepID=UPI001EF74A43|nr:hypothetical protein [Paenibacillus sp. ACRSA]MCG7378166.1 hypothetical protein [Paenibacillus sp. ACRSA]